MRSPSGAADGPDEPLEGSLVEADLDQVLAIERSSFSRPWEREHFLHELQFPQRTSGLALRLGPELVGYALGWILEPELSIVRLAIHPAFRRRGLGRRLVLRLIEVAGRRGCNVVRLEVRENAAGAVRLYGTLGFTEVGRRKGYYERDDADALLLELRLAQRAGDG